MPGALDPGGNGLVQAREVVITEKTAGKRQDEQPQRLRNGVGAGFVPRPARLLYAEAAPEGFLTLASRMSARLQIEPPMCGGSARAFFDQRHLRHPYRFRGEPWIRRGMTICFTRDI